jgi:hypothetical protein
MTVTWKNGARVATEAEVAYAELERIREERGGELHADDVVEASRSPEAPLHGEFEWDDAKAAILQRRSRAQELIRWVVVTVEEDTNREHPVRQYVRAEPEGKAGPYVPMQQTLADPDRRAALLQEALRKLLQWRTQYRHLNELSIIFRAHEEAMNEIALSADYR